MPAGMGGKVVEEGEGGLLYVPPRREKRAGTGVVSTCKVAFISFEMYTHSSYECGRILSSLLLGSPGNWLELGREDWAVLRSQSYMQYGLIFVNQEVHSVFTYFRHDVFYDGPRNLI